MFKKRGRRRLSAILGRKLVRHRKKRKNPPSTVAAIRTAGLLATAYSLMPNPQQKRFFTIIGRGENPHRKQKRVRIYARCAPFTIFAIKGNDSIYPGQRFRHRFTNGGAVFGNPDGSITIAPADRSKPLWGRFQQ